MAISMLNSEISLLMTPPLQNLFNLKIKYPPPYTREIWDYKRIETDLINCSIESFD